MKIDLNTVAVISNGSVDVDATLAAIRTEVEKFAADKVGNDEETLASVKAVYETHGVDKVIDMPTLVTLTLNKMNVPLEQTKGTGEKIADCIRRHKDSVFTIKRGKGGGVSLVKAAAVATETA